MVGSPFSRDVAGTAGARLLAGALGFLTAALGARLLGPGGWGVYAVALALTSLIAQFGNLGLHSANTYHVTREPALAPALTGNSLAVSLGVGVLAALLGGVAAFRPGLFPVSGVVLALALAGVPFLLAGILLRALLLGLGDVRAYNIAEVLPPAAMLAMIVAMGLDGVAVPTDVVVAGVCGLAAGALFSGAALRRHLRAPVRPSVPLFRTTFRFGARAYVAAFFSYALLRIDLLMVKELAGAAQAGLYSASVSFTDGLYLVPTVMGAILFPRLVRLPASERWRVTRHLTWRVAAALTVAAAIAAVLARPALTFVYGASFVDAVPAFRILAVAVIFIGANSLLSNHLAAVGFPLAAVAIWGVAAVANVALNALLIPGHGIAGAAVASLVCYAFVLVAQYSYARRRTAEDAGVGASSGGGTSPVRIAGAVPLDRERLLLVGPDREAGVRPLTERRPWLRAVGIDLTAPGARTGLSVTAADPSRLPFPSGSFDCVLAGALDAVDQDAALAEFCRVLREGGVFVSALPGDSGRDSPRPAAGKGGEPPDAAARDRFERAGFRDVELAPEPEGGLWQGALPPIVRVWKRAAPATELERAREAMGWVYRRLEPGAPPAGPTGAEDFIAVGHALCCGPRATTSRG
jgi:O-antigen/teichoic acid export membrane protein